MAVGRVDRFAVVRGETDFGGLGRRVWEKIRLAGLADLRTRENLVAVSFLRNFRAERLTGPWQEKRAGQEQENGMGHRQQKMERSGQGKWSGSGARKRAI